MFKTFDLKSCSLVDIATMQKQIRTFPASWSSIRILGKYTDLANHTQ